MSITFNGVLLNDNLIWVNRYDFTPVTQTTHRTLAGSLVVFSHSIAAGQPITLEATDTAGWFTGSMVASLKSFADVPGASYPLNFHGEDYTVIFDHEQDPVVSFLGLRPIEPQGISDPFSGILNLLTI